MIHSCRGNSPIWFAPTDLDIEDAGHRGYGGSSSHSRNQVQKRTNSRCRQSIVAVTCVMDSLKDDIAKMERCLETVSVMTDGWEKLLQRSQRS